ncbi:MAG: protein DpdD [Methylococcaceae bacterium]|nr:protein DpdD [Methylococcaceae bacterium]
MSSAMAISESGWVQTFFSGRNQLRWESIEAQSAPTRALANVMPWLKNLTISGYDGPVILPLYEINERITWYAMAGDDRRFAQMIDEISGFVGPSYSDFRGEWAQLSHDDAPECALAERFGPRIIKFTAVQASDQTQIETALALYLSVLTRRPETPDRTQRPFGTIRSDFDRALLAGNANGSQTLLEELLASGRVNAEQRKCLEIRLLAGLGQSETLAKNPALIASVSDVSLPAQTLVDVVVALYETFITPIESASDFETVIEAFRRHIFKPFGGLFRERKGIRHPKVLRAFLLSEFTTKEPSTLRCRSLLEAYPESAEGLDLVLAWCKKLKEPVAPPETDSKEVWLSQAKQAIVDEDYASAISLCFQLLPLPWAYSGLLRCALELDTTDVTKRVLAKFGTATEAILSGLTKKDLSRLDKLREPLPSINLTKLGWIAWAENVLANPLDAPSVTELQEMAVKWSVDEYANDTSRCDKLARRIVEAGGDAQNVFRDAFPVLVDFFESSFGSRRAFKPIYSTLIKCLAWSGTLSIDEVEIGAQLTQALLTTGPNKQEYIDAIEDLQEILKENASPIHFDWGLNLAELLSLYPAPDKGAVRLRFFMDVVGMLRAAPHRVSVAQRSILSELASDYNCPNLLDTFPAIEVSPEESTASSASYSGLVGIYTLTDGAGQRAKEIIERTYHKATVVLNNDDVSTDRLTALARSADIFVFAWKSSKHQAYFCVKEARREKDIILPLGKGSASILSSVLNKIESMFL